VDREQVAPLVELLEGEINNGGFHQFFYNSAGDETASIIRAVEHDRGAEVSGYCDACGSKISGRNATQRSTQTAGFVAEKVDPEIKMFEDLDQEFYAYPDDLQGLLEKFMDW